MKKNTIVGLIAVCLTRQLAAQETDSVIGNWALQVRADVGFIIAHKPALEPLQEEHVKGFEISLFRKTTGSHDWENTFHYPDYGITFAAFDLGSPSHLGTGFALYPYIDFPLGRKHNGGLHFRYGTGIGYVEKTFDKDSNIKNAGIGSHFNGLIHFDLHVEKNISKKIAVEIGAGLTHYSNGSFELPNLGINIATLNLAFSHSFGQGFRRIQKEVAPVDKTPRLQFYAAGFFKKVYPPLGKRYFAATLSSSWLKRVTLKSSYGIGLDVFYDNSLEDRIERYIQVEASTIDNFRSGIYGAYQLSVANIGLMFNMGYYLYTKWKEDGNIYHRICLRYYFEKTFLCFNLKTHYARADFIELGIGYRLK